MERLGALDQQQQRLGQEMPDQKAERECDGRAGRQKQKRLRRYAEGEEAGEQDDRTE